MPKEPTAAPPHVEHDQDQAQREQLADLHTHVERHHVRHEPIAREREVLQLGRQPKPMEKAEKQHGAFRVRLETELAKTTEVLERFVDHGQADHRVDEIRIHMPAREHSEQQRRAVTDREQRDVYGHVLEPVQEEDHAGQEQQVVVTGDHVLRAEVHVWPDVRTGHAHEECLVVTGDAVRLRERARE